MMEDKYQNHKKELSQNYTNADLVKMLLSLIPESAWKGATVLEPSCGDGSIVREILTHDVASVIAIDIDSEPLEYVKKIQDPRLSCFHADFLSLDFSDE
jgi:predicted RNA methylase